MKKIINIIIAVFLALSIGSTVVVAEDVKKNQIEHSDIWLQSKLVTTYILNRHLSIFDIDTDVKEQVVYLAGTVDSAIDRDLAGEVAKSIEGVKSVQNNLVVATQKRPRVATNNDQIDRSFGQQITDMTTTALLKTKLLTNKNVSGLNISIDTFNNIVTLKGDVESDEESALAEEFAKNTNDVEEVRNMLKVVTKS